MNKKSFSFEEAEFKTQKQIVDKITLSREDFKKLVDEAKIFIGLNVEDCSRTPRTWKSDHWKALTKKFLGEHYRASAFWGKEKNSDNNSDPLTWPEDHFRIEFLTFCVLKLEAPKFLSVYRKRTSDAAGEQTPSKKQKNLQSVERDRDEMKASGEYEKSPSVDAAGSAEYGSVDNEHDESHDSSSLGQRQYSRSESNGISYAVRKVANQFADSGRMSRKERPTSVPVGIGIYGSSEVAEMPLKSTLVFSDGPSPTSNQITSHTAVANKITQNLPKTADDESADNDHGPLTRFTPINRVNYNGQSSQYVGPDRIADRERSDASADLFLAPTYSGVPEKRAKQKIGCDHPMTNYQDSHDGLNLTQKAEDMHMPESEHVEPMFNNQRDDSLHFQTFISTTAGPFGGLQTITPLGSPGLTPGLPREIVFNVCIPIKEGPTKWTVCRTFDSSSSWEEFYNANILSVENRNGTTIRDSNTCRIVFPGGLQCSDFNIQDPGVEKIWRSILKSLTHPSVSSDEMVNVEFLI